MKPYSEKQALERLARTKELFRTTIRRNYEFRAKDCETCTTRGACCLDAHFVNVHISRLEAVAIKDDLARFSDSFREEVRERTDETISRYGLSESGDTFARTFACPLFDPTIGCLVHSVKPVACIAHACYESREHLPPDDLQFETESAIDRLNGRTYGDGQPWLPLPLWLKRLD